MDISKLKQIQDKLNDESIKELVDNIPPPFIQFTNSQTIKNSLLNIKTGVKVNQSARVINNWINQGILKVEDNDKGKIKRFNRLESIWLNIVNEARKFGLPLESLRQARKELFGEPIPNFSLLKFNTLDTILRSPKVLMISEDGHTNIISINFYSKWVSTGLLPTHLSFNLSEFIIPEFPNQSFNVDFEILDPYNEPNKCKLLYYLKTGDFKAIKFYNTPQDIRFIENAKTLLENPEILNAIKRWEFKKVIVIDNNDVEDIIFCQP